MWKWGLSVNHLQNRHELKALNQACYNFETSNEKRSDGTCPCERFVFLEWSTSQNHTPYNSPACTRLDKLIVSAAVCFWSSNRTNKAARSQTVSSRRLDVLLKFHSESDLCSLCLICTKFAGFCGLCAVIRSLRCSLLVEACCLSRVSHFEYLVQHFSTGE